MFNVRSRSLPVLRFNPHIPPLTPQTFFADQGSIMPLETLKHKYRRQLMTCDSSPRAWEYLRFQKHWHFAPPPAPRRNEMF